MSHTRKAGLGDHFNAIEKSYLHIDHSYAQQDKSDVHTNHPYAEQAIPTGCKRQNTTPTTPQTTAGKYARLSHTNEQVLPAITNGIQRTCGCTQYIFIANLFGIEATTLARHPPIAHLSFPQPINNELSNNGLFSYKVKGDGNCFFRSVSKFFFGHEEFHGHIRRSIVSFMEQHHEYFSTFSPVEIPFEEYIQTMHSTAGNFNSWAGDTEIFALATMLQINVYVYFDFFGKSKWSEFNPFFEIQSTFPVPYITMIHSMGNHYEVIKPINFCICKPPHPFLKMQLEMLVTGGLHS